jgi:adenine-specific DNA-methyltransferase
MAKIDVTRTELVWPGKYNEDGTLKETPRVSLPFQVIETVNESWAGREARKNGLQQSFLTFMRGKREIPSRTAGRTSSSGATTCW